MSAWAVVGGSGLLGQALVRAATDAGHDVRTVTAPRLEAPVGLSPDEVNARADAPARVLSSALAGADVVVNVAGLATPGARASPALTGANAVLPAAVVLAAAAAGAGRVVHLSSASVQGRRPVLDATPELDPQTPYAESKATGERALAQLVATVPSTVVVARVASVRDLDPGRPDQLSRIARSPLASVAGRGDAPLPITDPAGVARWVLELAAAADPPPISLQPWDGWTNGALLRELGGREPLHLPVGVARAVTRSGYAVSRLLGGRGWDAVRRVELLWFGQPQA